MAYINPRVAMLIDGLLGSKRPPMAPADQTARPTAREYGISDAARRALQKLAEWDTAAGRNVASRLPEGTTLQQGTVPDWISGPKGVTGGLKRTGPFDAAHALEMGKVRAAESAPKEMPDLLPAMAREGGADDALTALKSRMAAGEAPRATANPVDSWLRLREIGSGGAEAAWLQPKPEVLRKIQDIEHHLAVLDNSPELMGAREAGEFRGLLNDLRYRMQFK